MIFFCISLLLIQAEYRVDYPSQYNIQFTSNCADSTGSIITHHTVHDFQQARTQPTVYKATE